MKETRSVPRWPSRSTRSQRGQRRLSTPRSDFPALARRRWGRAFDPDGALARLGLDFQCTQALLGWSSGHYRGPDGRTALDLYLEERGSGLDAEGRALADAQRSAWFSYHEVVSAEPGRSIVLRDLLAGGERTVEEKSASRAVRPRDVLVARIVDLGNRAILAGCHLQTRDRGGRVREKTPACLVETQGLANRNPQSR